MFDPYKAFEKSLFYPATMASDVDNGAPFSHAMILGRAGTHNALDAIALALFAQKLTMLAGWKKVN